MKKTREIVDYLEKKYRLDFFEEDNCIYHIYYDKELDFCFSIYIYYENNEIEIRTNDDCDLFDYDKNKVEEVIKEMENYISELIICPIFFKAKRRELRLEKLIN